MELVRYLECDPREMRRCCLQASASGHHEDWRAPIFEDFLFNFSKHDELQSQVLCEEMFNLFRAFF